MQLIGLTGGIATGKSTSAAYLENHGIPVIDADKISRNLLRPDTWAYDRVCRAFPQALDPENGVLSRERLASLVFSNQAAKKKLESLLHPWIKLGIGKQLVYQWLIGRDRVIVDVPLLFEGGLNRFMSYTVVVYASEATQRARLQGCRQLTETEAQQRITSQMPTSVKCSLADIVIDNDGKGVCELYAQLDSKIIARPPNWFVHRVLLHALPLTIVMGSLLLGLIKHYIL